MPELTEDEKARVAAVRHEFNQALSVASKTRVAIVCKTGWRKFVVTESEEVKFVPQREEDD